MADVCIGNAESRQRKGRDNAETGQIQDRGRTKAGQWQGKGRAKAGQRLGRGWVEEGQRQGRRSAEAGPFLPCLPCMFLPLPFFSACPASAWPLPSLCSFIQVQLKNIDEKS
jgi:hypothetical protein